MPPCSSGLEMHFGRPAADDERGPRRGPGHAPRPSSSSLRFAYSDSTLTISLGWVTLMSTMDSSSFMSSEVLSFVSIITLEPLGTSPRRIISLMGSSIMRCSTRFRGRAPKAVVALFCELVQGLVSELDRHVALDELLAEALYL